MSSRCFALIPAAGAGARAAAAVPKQYVALNHEPMLVHTVRAFLRTPRIESVQVVLSADDRWPDSATGRALMGEAQGRLRFTGGGGATRAQSVAGGLAALALEAHADDWVLVHDAARPCITPTMIAGLIEALLPDAVGGLLALPVPDTVKRADAAGRVVATIDRQGLWLAQTPQMFRLSMLRQAYAAHPHVTDEAGAIEAQGLMPRLVEGSARNFKVTYPGDFALASMFLAGAGTGAAG